MRLVLFASTENAPLFLKLLRRERINYNLLHRVSFIDHPPFFKRLYNGVILDEDLIAQSSAEDLVKLELLKKILPCHSMPYSPNPSLDIDLATFFETCKRFPARSTRQQKRANINLPALLSSNNEFETPRDATALNISQNGCFLATRHQQKVGDRIWLNLDGLEGSSPLLSEVRWSTEEAEANLLPGMGVRFLEANQIQLEQLARLMREGTAVG